MSVLADFLRAHKERTGRGGTDLVFGVTAEKPFIPSTVRRRAIKAWKGAELDPIALHECRHTCASFLIDAGCNPKVLSVVMGHASIEITFDRYGHMMPGGERELGERMDQYLESSWKTGHPGRAV